MRIRFCYPEGSNKTLTFSYDDGVVEDRRLVDIFNKYQLKGTFHINGGLLDGKNRITSNEVKALYDGHEVSCHSYTHPALETVSKSTVIYEVVKDRKRLEKLVGYPVNGMSYPYGTYNAEIVEMLKSLGIVYSRTVKSTGKFLLPDDFLKWHPTCHHLHDIMEKAEAFEKDYRALRLFYVWGHSYEFDRQNNWDLIENFCERVSKIDNVWYATNIDIYNYLTALKQLRFSLDRKLVKNHSSLILWFYADDNLIKINPGELLKL